jgi:dephospho-CoA kinase
VLAIGLTGGVGCGKSAVATAFSRRGVPVIDADEIARALTAPGQPTLQQIADCLGAEFIRPDGHLDRAALRERVFTDPAARMTLERLLHPLVRIAIERQLSNVMAPYGIVVIPLLIEADMRDLVQRVLVVDCEPEQQIERVMRRDGSTMTQARAIVAAQIGRQERLAEADDVLVNTQRLETLEEAVESLHRRYLQLARPFSKSE